MSAVSVSTLGPVWRRVWQFAAVLAMLAAAPGAGAQDAGAATAAELAPPATATSDERPGRGWTLGDSGVHAGGYALAELSDYLGKDAELRLHSLSLFLSWQNESRWSAFAEVELEDILVVGPGETTLDDAYVVLERLHLDYAWSDALQARVGKFLTPIGRWNVIHAAPLTWTSSRPLITESTFPTNATGGMVHGVVPLAGRALEWSVYASPGEELARERGLDTFKEAYGLRLDYALTPQLQLGSSLVTFEQREERGEHKNLLGIDLLWTYQGYELSGEWAYRALSRDGDSSDEHGFYLQAVAPLWRPLYAVARYEGFDPAGGNEGVQLYIGGLAWRFAPGAVLKGEYRHATDNALQSPEGFLASISVLF